MTRAPPKTKVFVDREILRVLYVDKSMTTTEIANELSISRVILTRELKRHRLSRRIEGLC